MSIEYSVRPIEKWPYPETKSRKRSPFFAKYSDTVTLLDRELRALSAKKIVLQVDCAERDIRLDGQLRADARLQSPRVILAFETNETPLSFPCDAFGFWQHNLRAIALGLEALRKVDRYGITRHGEQYTGWKALPAAGGSVSTYQAALFLETHSGGGIGASAIMKDPDAFWSAYRAAAKRLHPDHGGDRELWEDLARARDSIETHFTMTVPGFKP